MVECLNSTIKQTFSDYEVIIIDDGSTDRSSVICDSFKHQYPEKIKVTHTENKGLIAARRLAIEKASGDFCVFVDSDDYIEPTLLETVDQYANKEENIDIVIYSFCYFGQQTNKRQRSWAEDSTVWKEKNKRELYECLVTKDTIDALWIKAIKTELLKKDPIDYQKYHGKNMSEDVLQSLYPLTFAQKVIFADIPLYNYRYNSESIARNFSSHTILNKNSSHVFEEIIKIIPLWGFDDLEILKKVQARWFTDVMYIFWKSCEFADSHRDWSAILGAKWHEMLPKSDINEYKNYVSDRYLDLYNDYINNRFCKIRMKFLRKRIFLKVRALKKHIF